MTVLIHFWRSHPGIWSEFSPFVAEVVEKCFGFFIVFGGSRGGCCQEAILVWQLSNRLSAHHRAGTDQQCAMNANLYSVFSPTKNGWSLPDLPTSAILHTKLKQFPQKALTGAVSYDIIINCISIFNTVTHFHAVIITAKSGGVKYENEVSKTIPKMGGLKT